MYSKRSKFSLQPNIRSSHKFPHALTQAQLRKRKQISQKLLRRHCRREVDFFSQVSDAPTNGFCPVKKALQLHVQIALRQRPCSSSFGIELDRFIGTCCQPDKRLTPRVTVSTWSDAIKPCRNVILLQDNAKPHIAKEAKKKLTELGWEHLVHPPYSPDLSPSDFHVSRSLEHFLNKKKFRDINHLRRELTVWFESKDNEFYERGIDLLPEKWQKCVDADGAYSD